MLIHWNNHALDMMARAKKTENIITLRNKTLGVMVFSETNLQRNYCYHPEVDYFPITACPQVLSLYDSDLVIIIIILFISQHFYLFIVTLHGLEHL